MFDTTVPKRSKWTMVIVVISNSFPASVVVKSVGSPTRRTTTLIKGEPLVGLQLDQYSTAQFEDDHGAIFDSAQNRLTTVIDGNRSFALVTLSDLGGVTGAVFQRNFCVVPNVGTLLVTPQVWTLNRHVKITWAAQASDPAATVDYTVGGLSPGSLYAVTDLRDGGRGNGRGNRAVSLGSYTADPNGCIRASLRSGTTANLTYSVIDR